MELAGESLEFDRVRPVAARQFRVELPALASRVILNAETGKIIWASRKRETQVKRFTNTPKKNIKIVLLLFIVLESTVTFQVNNSNMYAHITIT